MRIEDVREGQFVIGPFGNYNEELESNFEPGIAKVVGFSRGVITQDTFVEVNVVVGTRMNGGYFAQGLEPLIGPITFETVNP